MNDEQLDKLQKQQELAAQGKLVVSNPAYRAAFTAIQAAIFQDFCSSKQGDSEERDEAWRTIKNLDELDTYFTRMLQTGKMATESLKLYKE